MADVLATNDRLVGAPLLDLLEAGRADGTVHVADVRTAADAIVGALLMAVLGGAAGGRDTTGDEFVDQVTDQVLHGLVVG